MKKILTSAFAVAIAVACWSGLSASIGDAGKQSSVNLSNVEAISQCEVTILCGTPTTLGHCYIRSNSGHCVYTGYTVDYCV